MSLVTVEFKAQEFMPKFKMNPFWSIKEVEVEMMDRYGAIFNVYKCYRARSLAQLAQNMLKGTLEQHYTKLQIFLEEQKRIDPRGCFVQQNDLDEATNKCTFKSLYIGYIMLKNGFMQGCRRIIGLDETFLKVMTGGALLATVRKDCNNMMFPIA